MLLARRETESQRRVQRRLDLRHCGPGEQFPTLAPARPMAGQVNGQHLPPFRADHLGERLRLLLAAHLAVEK